MGKVRQIAKLVAAANDRKRCGIAYFYITNHHDIVAGWEEGWKQYDMSLRLAKQKIVLNGKTYEFRY